MVQSRFMGLRGLSKSQQNGLAETSKIQCLSESNQINMQDRDLPQLINTIMQLLFDDWTMTQIKYEVRQWQKSLLSYMSYQLFLDNLLICSIP